MNGEWTFRNLQEESGAWTLHNFGNRPAWQPLIGMAEEIGEFFEAINHEDKDGAFDGIADTVIFLADFCNLNTFDLETLYQEAKIFLPVGALVSEYGKLAHHFLKKTQGIRGSPALHNQGMQLAIIGILRCLNGLLYAYEGRDMHQEVFRVWEQVRKRDWKKNSDTGRPPPENVA